METILSVSTILGRAKAQFTLYIAVTKLEMESAQSVQVAKNRRWVQLVMVQEAAE